MDRSNKDPNADGVFDYAPYLNVNDDRLYYNSNNVDNRNPNYGSTSVVLRGAAPVPSVCD